MTYNYHTHTHRCRHAYGTEEEYVTKAIENGIKHMGFSDHVPLKFEDGTESEHRVPVCEGAIYCEEIKTLSKKYKDEIDIKVGFEMEHYEKYFEEMFKNAVEYGAEYLILGQHCIRPENVPVNPAMFETDSLSDLKEYVSVVISAMRTKVYTYVAHPDILNFTGDIEIYREEMRKLCVESRLLNIPLEINFFGIRDKRNYPNNNFWQIAGEEKSPVTFGFDSHNVESAYDEKSLVTAKRIVEKYDLNYIGAPELILIQKLHR